jgi:hypothetical protein
MLMPLGSRLLIPRDATLPRPPGPSHAAIKSRAPGSLRLPCALYQSLLLSAHLAGSALEVYRRNSRLECFPTSKTMLLNTPLNDVCMPGCLIRRAGSTAGGRAGGGDAAPRAAHGARLHGPK